jgi:lipopolysaccharide transport system permease protein
LTSAGAPADNNSFELILEPGKRETQYWRDLWRFRELFYFLAWRDILVRYKQTVIGLAWSVIRPVLTIVVFTIIFGRIAGLPSDGVPYPLLVLAAMLPWQLVSTSLSEAAASLVGNSSLLTKVYFPRMVIPASAIIISFIDFLISLGILAILMTYYRYLPPVQIVLLPAFVLLALVISLGTGLFFSALNVKYRDFRYVIPFLLQLGLYLSPVGFSSAAIPEKWRLVYSLNPLVGLIDGFRWAVLGGNARIYVPGLVLSVVVSVIMLIYGVSVFRRMERRFADVI